MTWNYRVMGHREPDGYEWFAVHEVYYTAEGKVRTWTDSECRPFGDTPDELSGDLDMMKAALSLPVLDYATGKEIAPDPAPVEAGIKLAGPVSPTATVDDEVLAAYRAAITGPTESGL